MTTPTQPLTPKEETAFRLGLWGIPSITEVPEGLSSREIAGIEWADRCRRVFATLDAERARQEALVKAVEAERQRWLRHRDRWDDEEVGSVIDRIAAVLKEPTDG